MSVQELDPRRPTQSMISPAGARALLQGLAVVASMLSVQACAKSSENGSDPGASDPKATESGTPPKTSDPAASVASGKPTEGATPSDPPASSGQWYRAVLAAEKLPEIPLFLQLPAQGASGTGKMVNGAQESELDASWSGKDLTIDFPLIHAAINAVVDEKGGLSGSWQVKSRSWGEAMVPFRAAPIDSPAPETRFDEKSLPGKPIDLGVGPTVWRARFPDSGVAKIEMEQVTPGVFNATVLFPTGNVVYLSGNGRGREIRLSALIGVSIYLVVGELDAAGKTLTGKWIAGPNLAWREKFKATRAADFDVKVTVKTAKRDQVISMPQLAAYKGKPLIVEVGGSWCDACKHAAAALRDIYGRYHSRGLEVVSLTYEFTDDTEYNKRQAESFKKTYDLPWEVISVDGSVEKAWEVIPQGIEGIDASGFPITLFVNRDGTIHAVHASFAGPENPKQHRRWLAEYERQAVAIVDGKGAAKK